MIACHGGRRTLLARIYLCLPFFLSAPAFSQATADVEHQLRLQQERLDEFRRQQQEKQRQHTSAGQLQFPPGEQRSGAGQKHCFPIYSLELKGDGGLLPKQRLDEASRDFFGYCVGVEQINQLIERLTRYYFAKGYVTTRVYLPQQDLGSAILRLEVVPGSIESVQFVPEEENRHLSLVMAVPLAEGEHFNLRALEQGLDQLNRLSSNNARVELMPGDIPGASRVLISNQPARRYRASLGYDNSGDKSTGELQRNLLLEWDSPLTLNDYIYLYYQGGVKDSVDGMGSESASLHYSIPYRYWTYSLDISRFEYLSTVQGFLTSFESSGISESTRMSADRLAYRDQQNKVNVKLGLSRRKNRNFIEDVLLETSSRTLSSGTLGVSWQRYGQGGDTVFADLTYHRGLKVFGALEDESGLAGEEPRAQFEKYRLNLNYRTALAALGHNWYWRSSLRGQYSDDRLYSSEQFTIGTGGSVRGYKSLGLSGDSGAVTAQELGTYIPFDAGWLGSTGLQLALGLEVGDVRLPQQGKQSLKSWYSSANWSGRHFRINLTYAEPIAPRSAFEAPGRAVYGSFTLEI